MSSMISYGSLWQSPSPSNSDPAKPPHSKVEEPTSFLDMSLRDLPRATLRKVANWTHAINCTTLRELPGTIRQKATHWAHGTSQWVKDHQGGLSTALKIARIAMLMIGLGLLAAGLLSYGGAYMTLTSTHSWKTGIEIATVTINPNIGLGILLTAISGCILR